MPIEFATATQKEVYELVGEYMRSLYGEEVWANPESPTYSIRFGSTVVYAFVNSFLEDNAAVNVYSYVVRGAELTQDLLLYLMQQNDGYRFGAFGLDSKNTVVFRYTIPGKPLDKSVLRAAVNAVRFTADDQDDKIVARWGGQRAFD